MKVLRGREEKRPFSASVDVVVIGSGAGGAVVARELAVAGRSVIVVEEGGHYSPTEYGSMSPTQSFRHLAREAGMSAVVGLGETPLIALLAGKCVGGSSVLTGGVCFRIPEEIVDDWTKRLKLPGLTEPALAPYYAEVEEKSHVETVPVEMRSRATELFCEGAEKLGISMKPTRRNTRGCKGAARCNFGCPNGAKMSVDATFLPEAELHGAQIVSDALVERVEITGGVARGVRGRFFDQDTGEPNVPFTIRAKVVVVACGSMHTPILLRRSGLDSKHIGRHLTLHPAFRVGALFDEDVNGWDGALQSVYSDHFKDEGITLVGVYSAVNVLAAAFPGVGQEHRRLVKELPRLAFFGGMIHDDGGGTVRRWLGREPLVTYRMIERDRRRLFKGIKIVADMAFAAGAKEVLLPIFGMSTVKSAEDLRFLEDSPPDAPRVECIAFHPLGSAKMANHPDAGVVKPSGETWAVENLFVIDGSILPTSIGVNSQLPIMTIAMKLARALAEHFSKYARRAA